MRSEMKVVRFIYSACAVATLVFSVSACGVKSAPEHPTGSTFPETYPNFGPSVRENYKSDDKRASDQSPANSGSSIYHYPNLPSYEPPKY